MQQAAPPQEPAIFAWKKRAPRHEPSMTGHSDPASVQLQVNLIIVQGHYENAVRLHFWHGARAAQYVAIRDIPFLISEIERLWELLVEAKLRYANLQAAALATMTAYDAYQTDPLSHLRAALSADDRRRRGQSKRT
jgi:hypothetical protein